MARETKLQIVVDAQDRTKAAFNDIQNNLGSVGRSYTGLQSTLTTIGAAGTAAFGALALLSKEIVSAGVGIEQTNIAFETMLGSADLAKKTLTDLANFAKRTPFQLLQIEEASKRLLAYGITAEDLIPTLTMLGDITAGVGMDKLPQLILAFGQVSAATRLTGMELRQFSEAGVPLLGALAQHFGKTAAEVQEMVSAGEVGFADVKAALTALTAEGGRFHDLMAKQSQSLGGLWSTLKDNIELTARAMGNEMLPYLKPVVQELIRLTAIVGEFVKENPKLSAGILLGALAFTAVLAVLLPIALALPGIIMMFTALGVVFGVVTAMTAPMLLVVGGLIAIMALLVTNGYLTKEAWQDVWLGIKVAVADAANAVTSIVQSMINFIINGVNQAINAINRVAQMAQKVPGVGKLIGTMGTISAVDLGSIDTNSIVTADIARRSQGGTTYNVMVTGNTLLDRDAGTRVGDMFINQLKMTSSIPI